MVELKSEAPEEQRAAANGALFASSTTAQLVGPLLGAFALAWSGPAVVFALNGLTFLGVALAVTQLRGGLAQRPTQHGKVRRQSEEAGKPSPLTRAIVGSCSAGIVSTSWSA